MKLPRRTVLAGLAGALASGCLPRESNAAFPLGVASGDYDMAPVASDVFDRMIIRGTVKKEDFRILYKSPVFPTSSFAYAHDLKPELAEKLKACFYQFRFTPEMTKEFNGNDRFVPITYQKNWEVVRRVAEGSGTPYNRVAYEREAKREAEAAAEARLLPPCPCRRRTAVGIVAQRRREPQADR